MNLESIRTLIKNQEIEKALEGLDAALLAEPQNILFWNLRGHAIQLNDSNDGPPLSEAEQCYLKALELAPNDLDTIDSLAHFYDAVGNNPDEAKKFARQYLTLTQKASMEMTAICDGTSWM